MEGRGEFDEGLRRSEQFFQFDKETAIARVAYARFLYHKGEYEKVISIVEESIEKRKNFNYLWFSLLSASYRHLGQNEKADQYVRKLEESADKSTKYLYALAVVYSELGRFAEAVVMLEKCFDQHEELLVWMKNEPRFGNLKNDSRFQKIAEKMRLN